MAAGPGGRPARPPAPRLTLALGRLEFRDERLQVPQPPHVGLCLQLLGHGGPSGERAGGRGAGDSLVPGPSTGAGRLRETGSFPGRSAVQLGNGETCVRGGGGFGRETLHSVAGGRRTGASRGRK